MLFSACSITKRAKVEDEQNDNTEVLYVDEPSDDWDLDSLVLTTFHDTYSYMTEISRIDHLGQYHKIYSSYSEDDKVRFFSVHCGGTMNSGTAYVLYRKSEKELVVKKIAYMEQDPEGGIDCPALFVEIHNSDGGYSAFGVFSFSSTGEAFGVTLFVSNEFLNSNRFRLE